MTNTENVPLISVVMITYNHEKYIEEAINSILMQTGDFNLELIISNDCSPDNTDSLIKSIQKNHPKGNFINYHLHPKNIGMMPNFLFALNQAKGDYIAICEGDDFWTDPTKLQKQIKALKENSKSVLCFHNVDVLKNSKSTNEFYHYTKNEYFTTEIIENWIIPTASVLYRNVLKNQYPEWMNTATHGDLGLFLLIGQHGSFYCINEKMGAYRINETSVTVNDFNTLSHRLKHINQINSMDQYFNYEFHKVLIQRKFGYQITTAFLLAKNKYGKSSREHLLSIFREAPFKSFKSKYFYGTIWYLIKQIKDWKTQL